jgi:hypothetical protein
MLPEIPPAASTVVTPPQGLVSHWTDDPGLRSRCSLQPGLSYCGPSALVELEHSRPGGLVPTISVII